MINNVNCDSVDFRYISSQEKMIHLPLSDEVVWEIINPNRQKQGTTRLDTLQESLVQSVCR